MLDKILRWLILLIFIYVVISVGISVSHRIPEPKEIEEIYTISDFPDTDAPVAFGVTVKEYIVEKR